MPALVLALMTRSAGHAQDAVPKFRSGIDIISVDVDVLDNDGAPVAGLRPEQFQVSIDGKARKVISADFLSSSTRVSIPTRPEGSHDTNSALPASVPDPAPGRTYVLAFDTMSFHGLDVEPARKAARAFVERLDPKDRVGFIAFPHGATADLSTDRTNLYQQLDRTIGEASPTSLDPYGLTPAEIVDLTYLYQKNDQKSLRARVGELCATTSDPNTCRTGDPPKIVQIASAMAQFQEAEIGQRLGALERLFRSLARSTVRKTVVLISAGIEASDRPGGRPDSRDTARQIGQRAAEANASIYALHFDRLRAHQMSASTGGVPRQSQMARESALLAQSLDQIAGTSGGALVTVVQGGGEFAFDRILKETSAHYLLGVEPLPKDRDGRAHHCESGSRSAVSPCAADPG